jgi:hypothetical protein
MYFLTMPSIQNPVPEEANKSFAAAVSCMHNCMECPPLTTFANSNKVGPSTATEFAVGLCQVVPL